MSLREHLAALRAADMKLMEARLELIEAKLAAMEAHRVDKAEEYRIHFDSLNNEAARILSAAEKSVSLEKFEGFEQRFNDYVKATDRALTLKEGAGRGLAGLWGFAVGAIGAIGVAVAVVIALTQ